MNYHRLLSVALALASALAGILGIVEPASSQSENMTLLGQRDAYPYHSGVWGFTHANGTELAIIGTEFGTSFVNVTNPPTMTEVAFINGPSSGWREIRTWQNYAYISTEGGGGIQIVNMTNPLQPVLAGTYGAAFSTCHSLHLDEQTGYLYCNGTNNGLVILNLANPTSPTVAATYTNCYVHDSYSRDGIAYFASIFDCDLMVADVSSLPAIDILATVPYSGAATHNVWLTDDGSHLLTTDETSGGHIKVWDVTDPSNPFQVSEWLNPDEPNSSVHNVTVRGDFAYVSWYTAGVQILDLSDPLLPDRVGYYDTYAGGGLFDGNWGVFPFLASGHVVLSDMDTGLYLLGFDANFGTLDGTVTDAETADPLESVTVRVEAAGQTRITDAAGYYRMNLSPDTYDVSYERFGYGTETETVTITQGTTTTRDVALQRLPSGNLAGVVRSADGGAPLPSAIVSLLDTPLETASGADGSYMIPDVPVGLYTAHASLFGFAPRSSEVSIAEDQLTPLDFSLTPAFYADDIEIDRGWTIGAQGDGAATGIWVRADPVGTAGGAVQPEDDHTPAPGTICFVTGNCTPGCGIGDNDVDGGRTTLLSPILDLSGLQNPALSYYRWYTNNAGNNPGEDTWVVDISSDGGATWTGLEATQQSQASWEIREFVLADYITPTAGVRLRFIASDLGNGSVVEAAVDDFQIYEGLSPASITEPGFLSETPVRLLPNAPNPFRGSTNLRFELAARGPITMEILDVSGRVLRRLVRGVREAGAQVVLWDGRGENGRELPAGVYFACLRAADQSVRRKLVRIE